MDSIEEFELQNKTVNIYYDGDGESPRDWDNLGNIVCFHSRYNLGDDHDFKSWQQWIVALAEEHLEPYQDKISGWYTNELWEYAAYNNIPNPDMSGNYPLNALNDLLDKHYIILPIYAYEHGGIILNTSGFSCPWDSGQIGYIYVSKDKVRKDFGWKNITKQRTARIESYLTNEIKILSQWVMGEVFYFVSTCNTCGAENSCGGFFGFDWKENGLLESIDDFGCHCEEEIQQ